MRVWIREHSFEDQKLSVEEIKARFKHLCMNPSLAPKEMVNKYNCWVAIHFRTHRCVAQIICLSSSVSSRENQEACSELYKLCSPTRIFG